MLLTTFSTSALSRTQYWNIAPKERVYVSPRPTSPAFNATGEKKHFQQCSHYLITGLKLKWKRYLAKRCFTYVVSTKDSCTSGFDILVSECAGQKINYLLLLIKNVVSAHIMVTMAVT